MSGLSEDESSDSSNEFLVDPDKINLNSTFFAEQRSKGNTIVPVTDDHNNSTDSDDSDDYQYVSQESNVELFSQVLKNLNNTQNIDFPNENKKEDQPVSTSSTSRRSTKAREEGQKVLSSNEIDELLLQGESGVNTSHKELEEPVVSDEGDAEVSEEYAIPKDGVSITLPGSCMILNRKKKKGNIDVKAILRRRLKANQILVEKVGLLCWLAHGFHLNRLINEAEVMKTALTLLSATNYPKNRVDLTYLEKFTNWFKNLFSLEDSETNRNINKEVLLKVLKEKKVYDYKELVLLYVAVLRALGLHCRLVISLCPPHRVYSDNPLFRSNEQTSKAAVEKKSTKSRSKPSADKETSPSCTTVPKNSAEAKRNANLEARKRASEVLQAKLQVGKVKKKKLDGVQDTESTDTATKKSRSTKGTTEKKVTVAEDDKKGISSLRQLRSRKIVNTTSKDVKTGRPGSGSSKSDGTTSKYYKEESTDSEGEFEPNPKELAKRKLNNIDRETHPKVKPKNRKLLSSNSDDDDETNKGRKTQDIWAEVYLESEESWICVSVMDGKVHCVSEVYKKAKKPVLYVVAWNSEGLIKDVTRRYCPQWLTVTRKQRIEEKWWQESLSHWKERNTAISKAEDEMLLQKELEQPLPKTVGACKGHPLYVLARHLLKYEALYPPDCVPLGHTNTGEAIYSRHCVHTLCSRETWLKKARVVKPNQEPYKIVKALPKFDKLSGTKIKDTPLEIFGEWQTMEYVPPEAKDGIVPRNEYGNVDLFKMCMLPKGTVHIDLPALNRVARKLNIDCAPAVVGFNFGAMGAVPAFEGFVVCEEYEDTLREAWEAEQVEAAKRAKERREKRVYGNWKRLIHGLLIRERLAAKYEFSEEGKSTLESKRTKQKKGGSKKTRGS